jgi:ribosomal protein L11 methyltransferase
MQEENFENPFKSQINLWHVEFNTRFKNIPFLDLIFEANTVATSSYELKSDSVESLPDDLWAYICYFPEEIDQDLIYSLAGTYIEGDVKIFEEKEEDWVSIVQKDAKPVLAGKFFVANENLVAAKSDSQTGITIIMNAGRAFGTGEHETTSLCLELISEIKTTPQNILDVGTGTGILSIACKKLWQDSYLLATDIDHIAIDIAKENARINEVRYELSVSYEKQLNQNKFDLIISNILANPLIQMASDFHTLLSGDGQLILSGFIANQEKLLIDAYHKEGFVVLDKKTQNDWVALLLKLKR